MRKVGEMTLLVGACVWIFLGPPQVFAQACQDEVSMVDGSKQGLTELIETIKKESLADFQTHNHQKSAVSKLTLHASMLGELVRCLDKASQNTTASKEDVAAAKTRHDAAAKLQEKLQQQRDAIRDAKEPKDAKTLCEKVDLTG